MKNEKGVTMVSLVVTIILMVILASVTTYSGIESYKDMKKENYIAQLKVIQEKVNLIAEEYQNWEGKSSDTNINNYLGTGVEGYSGLGFSKITDGETTLIKLIEEASDSKENYYYFSTDNIKDQLGLKGFEKSGMSVAVNFGNRNVIEKKGIKQDNVEYHSLKDFGIQANSSDAVGNGNADYEIKPEIKNYGLTAKVVLNVKKAQKDGQDITISGFEYKKKSEGSTDDNSAWKSVEEKYDGKYAFTVTESGTYVARVKGTTGGSGETDSITVTLVNPPVLETRMKAKIWDKNAKTWQDTSLDSGTWFDYSSNVNNWANAVDSFGNWWVWIPRYAYSLDTANKKIKIDYLKELSSTTTSNKALETGEIVHPAFTKSKDGKFTSGEWDSEISGFWISKYQMSEGGKSLPAKAIVSANVNTTNGTLKPTLPKLVPNTTSSVHLCKTSEHGAVLYLTYYNEVIKVTNNDTRYTGGGSGEKDFFINTNMSSTKNTTGVYDLCTTNGEFVAGKIVSSDSDVTNTNTNLLTGYLKSNDPPKIKGDAINDSEEAISNCISQNPNQISVKDMTVNQFIIFGKRGNSSEHNIFYCESGTTAGYRAVLITK